MIEAVYQFLEGVGFTHPLHPALTHIPMGMAMGGVTFFFIYAIFNRPDFLTAAYYCMGLGFLGIFPTALLGVMDWQYHFEGVWSTLFVLKIGFAVGLTAAMLVAIKLSMGNKIKPGKLMAVYLLCLAFAIGLGFMGGESQYG